MLNAFSVSPSATAAAKSLDRSRAFVTMSTPNVALRAFDTAVCPSFLAIAPTPPVPVRRSKFSGVVSPVAKSCVPVTTPRTALPTVVLGNGTKSSAPRLEKLNRGARPSGVTSVENPSARPIAVSPFMSPTIDPPTRNNGSVHDGMVTPNARRGPWPALSVHPLSLCAGGALAANQSSLLLLGLFSSNQSAITPSLHPQP